MKKKILMALALAAVGLLSIGGTVAYLTDDEASTSEFTIGDVNIALLQNNAVNGVVELMPSGYNHKNNLDTKTQIKNIGKNDAYVWLTLAIPSGLDVPNPTQASDNVLHWNLMGAFWNGYHGKTNYHTTAEAAYPGEYVYPVKDEQTWINDNVVIDTYTDENGVTYNVYVLKYAGVLKAGETTTPGLSTVYLDARLDYNEETSKWVIVEKGVEHNVDHDFSKGSSLIVKAHAIQADNFDNFDAAYAAYYNQKTAE